MGLFFDEADSGNAALNHRWMAKFFDNETIRFVSLEHRKIGRVCVEGLISCIGAVAASP
jgi:hypothetical protein